MAKLLMILSAAATLLLLVAFAATGAPTSFGIVGSFSESVQSKNVVATELVSANAPTTIVDGHGRELQDQSNVTNAPAWATTPPGSHWACHGAKPLATAPMDVTIPICLKISPGGVSSSYDAARPGRVPSRALCLLGATSPLSPPVYCYNDPEAFNPNMYLWWSPCEKCGTAWRLFHERDDDQSWYKLPSYPRPLGDELPSDDGWLGWTGDAWASTSMSITPCEQPETECYIFDSTTGGNAEPEWDDQHSSAESSTSDIGFLDGPKIVAILLLLSFCCCISFLCSSSKGHGGGRGQWNHGYSGGGGGGDSGGGGGGGGGGDGGGC